MSDTNINLTYFLADSGSYLVAVIMHQFSSLLVIIKEEKTRHISSQPDAGITQGMMASQSTRTQDRVTTLFTDEKAEAERGKMASPGPRSGSRHSQDWGSHSRHPLLILSLAVTPPTFAFTQRSFCRPQPTSPLTPVLDQTALRTQS